MIGHQFIVQKTARYYTINKIESSTRHVWWVLHGYGQLARFFIQHFEPLTGRGHVIIAPEGLSRFYLSNDWERVGASWMTKEDRLHEITDQLAYLNALQKYLYPDTSNISFKTHILGFSQGTATAWRWLGQSNMDVDNLILWAGMIPTDFNERIINRSKMAVHTVFGTEDPFFSEEKLLNLKEIINQSGLQSMDYTFNGKHTIDKKTLMIIADKLESK